MEAEEPKFREVQHFPSWATAVMVASALLVLVLALLKVGKPPLPLWAGFLIAALLVGLFLLLFRMTTTVYIDRIVIEFGWLRLVRFKIPLSEVQSCRPVTYRPLREFGGWGIRYGWGGKRAYSTHGNKAVELVTTTHTILIGTDLPYQLSDTINSLLPHNGSQVEA